MPEVLIKSFLIKIYGKLGSLMYNFNTYEMENVLFINLWYLGKVSNDVFHLKTSLQFP